MVIKSYKLLKNLTGRSASQFNWGLNSIPHQVFLRIHDGRIVNGKSLIGLLSGRFLQGDTIEVATHTQEEAIKIKEIIESLEIGILVENQDFI